MSTLFRMGMAIFACALVSRAVMKSVVKDDGELPRKVLECWLYEDTTGMQSTWILVQDDNDAVAGTDTDGETIEGSICGENVCLNLHHESSRSTEGRTGTLAGYAMCGGFTNSAGVSGSWTAVRVD